MSTTVNVTRLGNGRPGTAVEMIHSPDDGGYYLHHADFINKRVRTSAKVYSTEQEARQTWHRGEVEWEEWRSYANDTRLNDRR